MHIPDGFLAIPIWLTLDVGTAAGIVWCARKAQEQFGESTAPFLGVLGAFVFAAQMVNFPIAPGTSGHLVGGGLLACLLGPYAAAVIMTAVLAIQAVVFQDGGLLALGANAFNMALAGIFSGWVAFRLMACLGWNRIGLFLAGFVSVFVASVLTLLELLLSGVVIPRWALLGSLGLFSLLAAVEGVATMAVVRAVQARKPYLSTTGTLASKPAAAFGIAALLLALAGVFVASSDPDVLEALSEQVGIAERARRLLQTPFADYQASFIADTTIAQLLAAVTGLIVMFLIAYWLARKLRAQKG